MNIFEKIFRNIKTFFEMDNYVTSHRREEIIKNQRGIALIGFIAFLIMSGVNIYSKSWTMLWTTLAGSVLLLIGYITVKATSKNVALMVIFLIVYVGIFSAYTIGIDGGNDGFAALWVLLGTYVALIGVSVKLGIIASLYFMIFIFIVYQTPCQSILQYDFDPQFKLRFPYLFIINFALAMFIVVSLRRLQYFNFKKQEELEKIYNMDQLTNVYNRSNFVEFAHKYNHKNCRKVACFCIDVNGMHDINNLKGHEAGDAILKDIAYELKNDFAGDYIYRMGGDEFLVVALSAVKEDFLERINLFKEDVNKNNYSLSTGFAYKEDDVDIESLLKEADDLMIKDKENYHKTHKDK